MGKHCIVIGAGIVGTSCAWHLEKKGLKVTLVDSVLPGQSCTFGNAACIAASGVIPSSYPGVIRKLPGWLLDPLGPIRIRPRDFPSLLPWLWKFWRAGNMRKVEEIAAAQASLMRPVFTDFDEILNATGSAHLKRSRGVIFLYDTHQQYLADRWQAELAARFGYAVRRLDPAELKNMAPCLKPGNGVALLDADWHHVLEPARLTQRIADDCIGRGADWLHDRVTAASAAGGHVSLQTESGRRLQADQLVVAAGAWSNAIARQLDHEVPLTAKRGYHSMIRNPGVELRYPVMSVNRHFVMTPMEGGLRVAGTAEFAAIDAEPDYRRAKALTALAGRYLEGLDTTDVTEWMGPRPMMADSKPVISVSPRHHNVFYAFGHGHYGLTQGPTTGRIIAGLVAGETPSIDLAPFRFDRF